ncbi:MAG TPA: hypothetical protein DCL77_19825, partial [Prolixibacteraceae bacterium]|nr:hypothetical protein [Prolixibacteraceae bacterium]
MKSLSPSLIFIFIFFLFIGSQAQIPQVSFNPILGNDGISLGKINSITQDPQSYIWFSDQDNGIIIRYDGSRMTSYKNDPKNQNSLGGDYPEHLFADSTGIIWIGFYGTGLDRFDPESGTFTHFRHNKNDPFSLSNDSVTSVLMDQLGNIWVGTYGGLDLLDQKAGTFTHYTQSESDPASLSCNKIRAIYEDHQGTLWIGTGNPFKNNTNGGLNRFNRKTGKFTRFMNDPKDSQSIINNKVRAIFEDSRGNFWIGVAGTDGLLTMNRVKGTFIRHPYDPQKPDQLSRPPVTYGDKSDHITFITEDGLGAIWIGTYSQGILKYEPTKQTLRRFYDENKPSGLKDKSGWCAYVSKDGVIWMSTQEKNLYRVDPYENIIPHFKAPPVNCFYEDSTSTLWIGTVEQGILSKNLRSGIIHQYKNDPLDKTSLSFNNVSQLIKDPGGDFWVGMWGGGVNRMNKNTKKFTRFMHDPKNSQSLISDNVVTVYLDRESNLWVGTTDGCDVLDIKTGQFRHYVNNPKDTSSISKKGTTSFLEDTRNNFWIGTWNGGGIQLLDRHTGKFKHYLVDKNIYVIFEDSKAVIWVGTTSGIFQYDLTSDKFKLLNENTVGFQIPNAWGIVSDHMDNIWFASSLGIIKLNQSRDKITIYGKKNGVNGKNLYHQTGYKSTDGHLFFGDSEGFFSFLPEQINYYPVPPSISLNAFWINGKSIKPTAGGLLQESILKAKKIQLHHNQNVFSFDISTIDYGNPENSKIVYRLLNYDREWNTVGSDGKAAYYNVPPGKYTFQAKAINSNNGIWTEKSLDLSISPPFWKTWVAYCLYGLILIATIFGVDRFQRRRLLETERERTRDRELAQAKEIEKAYTELKATQAQLIQSEKMA